MSGRPLAARAERAGRPERHGVAPAHIGHLPGLVECSADLRGAGLVMRHGGAATLIRGPAGDLHRPGPGQRLRLVGAWATSARASARSISAAPEPGPLCMSEASDVMARAETSLYLSRRPAIRRQAVEGCAARLGASESDAKAMLAATAAAPPSSTGSLNVTATAAAGGTHAPDDLDEPSRQRFCRKPRTSPRAPT